MSASEEGEDIVQIGKVGLNRYVVDPCESWSARHLGTFGARIA